MDAWLRPFQPDTVNLDATYTHQFGTTTENGTASERPLPIRLPRRWGKDSPLGFLGKRLPLTRTQQGLKLYRFGLGNRSAWHPECPDDRVHDSAWWNTNCGAASRTAKQREEVNKGVSPNVDLNSRPRIHGRLTRKANSHLFQCESRQSLSLIAVALLHQERPTGSKVPIVNSESSET